MDMHHVDLGSRALCQIHSMLECELGVFREIRGNQDFLSLNHNTLLPLSVIAAS